MKDRLIKGLIECFVYAMLVGLIFGFVIGGTFKVLQDHGIDLNKPIYIQIVIQNDTLNFNKPQKSNDK